MSVARDEMSSARACLNPHHADQAARMNVCLPIAPHSCRPSCATRRRASPLLLTPPTLLPPFLPPLPPLASQPPNYTEATPKPAAALAAFDPEPTTCAAASQAVISPKSYSTAASQPAAVGPKLSSAASKLSADPKLSVAPSQPAADTTLLEVNTCMCICVACAALAWLLHGMCT